MLLTLFVAWNVTLNFFKELETKRSDTPRSSGTPIILIDNRCACLNEHSVFSLVTRSIVEMFSCHSRFIMFCNELKISEYKNVLANKFSAS